MSAVCVVYVVTSDPCCECDDHACICGSDPIHEIFMNKEDAELEASLLFHGSVEEWDVIEGPGLMTRNKMKG
jgi:hypothetical protein